MNRASSLIGIAIVFTVSVAALGQTAANLTGVNQISNATTALRLLQCYRETPAAAVVCDLQVTNIQADQPLALNLSVAQVTVVAAGKSIAASSLKPQEARTATQKISLIVDPRVSKRFSATFGAAQSVASFNFVRVGGFQFTDAMIAKSKPSAAIASVLVLNSSQLDFAIGSYQFTFKGFTFDNGVYVAANFDVISNAAKEEPLGAKNISMRIFDSTGAQFSSAAIEWSTNQRDVSVPPGVAFQLKILLPGTNRQLYANVSSAITKYLELSVNGETRTFQNIDLRSLAR